MEKEEEEEEEEGYHPGPGCNDDVNVDQLHYMQLQRLQLNHMPSYDKREKEDEGRRTEKEEIRIHSPSFFYLFITS